MSDKTFLKMGTIKVQIPEPRIISSFSELSALEKTFGISEAMAQHPYSPLEVVYQEGDQEIKQLIFVAPELSKAIHDIQYGVWINIPTTREILSLAISCPPANTPDETEKEVLEQIPKMWMGELADLVDFGCWIAGPAVSMASRIPLLSPLAVLVGRQVKKAANTVLPAPARTTKEEIRRKIMELFSRKTGQLRANTVGGLHLNFERNEALIMGVPLDKYPITITLPPKTSLYVSGSLNDNTLVTCQALSSYWKDDALIVTFSPVSRTVIAYKQGEQHLQETPCRIRGILSYRFVDLSAVQVEVSSS